MWVLLNHFRDEEESWEKQKILCRFINPQMAELVFDKKDVEVSASTEDALFDQMTKDLKNRYSAEELEEILKDPKHFSELDVIQKA